MLLDCLVSGWLGSLNIFGQGLSICECLSLLKILFYSLLGLKSHTVAIRTSLNSLITCDCKSFVLSYFFEGPCIIWGTLHVLLDHLLQESTLSVLSL